MNRIVLPLSFFLLAILMTGWVNLAGAQTTKKIPRIGYLAPGTAKRSYIRSFSKGLRELGYVEGQNIIIEPRYAGFKLDRLPTLAAELVDLKVDVIIALTSSAAPVAKKAITTIPIVIRTNLDPVLLGYVASVARPGGNITGVWSMTEELIGKRLELLREVIPGLSRVAVLWNPTFRRGHMQFKVAEAAAKAQGLQLQSLPMRDRDDLRGVFEAATKERAEALITLRDPFIVRNRKHIADLSLQTRLPAVYDSSGFVKVGGLISYGTSLSALHRRAANLVDKILKGAKPADLPIEQARDFELRINLKTAEQLGITIPSSVLYRADKVIK